MPRGSRKIYSGAILNVTSRRNNKRNLFRKEKDYLFLKKLLLKYKTKYDLKIFHYCLMKTHIHILVKIDEPKSLSNAMHGLQLAYFRYFNNKYTYTGRFWQGRFHSRLVEDDKYLLTAGLYIERNPVKAGITKDPCKYKWSSYNIYAYGVADELIDLNPYYLDWSENKGQREMLYRQAMQDYIDLESAPFTL